MKNRGTLYRNTQNKRIAGVCSGLADYFGIEIWLMRILTISAFFLLAPPFVIVSYVAAWFILDKKPSNFEYDETSTVSMHTGKGWKNSKTAQASPVELKTKVWQAGEPPRRAFRDIKERFENAEQRLRQMETYVTSKEYQLKREISNL